MDIRIPQLAEGVESGTVVSVLVKEGQQVQKDQTVLEIETKKAVAPIPATEAGTVSRILVKEGQEVAVGQAVISLTAAGAPAAAQAATSAPAKPSAPANAAPASQQPQAPQAQTPAPPAGNGHSHPDEYAYESKSGFPPAASPSLRRMASDLGIDLTRVRGSEAGGRITLADLKNYIQKLQQLAFQGRAAAAPTTAAPAKPAAPSVDFGKWGPVTKKPMTNLRKMISERMVESWTRIPHVTQFAEADGTLLAELRKKHAPVFEKKGARLTLTGFLLKAVVNTLKKHPIFNASMDEAAQEIVFKEYYHIGMAVDTEQGLIVPVLRDVDKKDLVTLSKELNDLAEKTRARKVGLEDLQGGSFTISNQGGIGGAHFTPIINRPELAILGVGQGQVKPVYVGQKIEPRTLIPLGLSYDHRVIDGGSAARFIKDLVAEIENFKESDVKLK